MFSVALGGHAGPAVFEALLSGGADVLDVDKDGNAVLACAARGGASPELIRKIVGQGANVNRANRGGRTALMEAAALGTDAGTAGAAAVEPRRNVTGVAANQTRLAKVLCSFVCDHDVAYDLWVDYILRQGADVNAPVCNADAAAAACVGNSCQRPKNTTPLMCAAGFGRTAALQTLLDRNASLESRDPQGFTALMWAAIGDLNATVNGLLASRA
eukprot:CAMPEP_0177559798 /NCGR_PEP_ID=MMETSP0369-20130122/71038_1 /TAXON_ID=447022 ORGANISM="Scrippsiella hangoei-like, Strain SHHI-4" /NCGR_SAMPLE_ID=MMETSP0369 /ASSEMBLY_ACC=CAM_ASM_000364 /LENGTH=214 /DNA_ID=CAMNT_0019046571 /DNA_START=1 /DNA_END=642 /DNA_ORIENTATION=+